ncbi:MAG: S9 family peptidase [Flavobacteriales bacterium]
MRGQAIFLLSLFVAPFLVQAQDTSDQELTNQKIWFSREFIGARISIGPSMQDGEHYSMITRNEKGDKILGKYEYKSGKRVKTILEGSELVPEGKEDPISLDDHHFGPNEEKLLIASQKEKIYRRSRKAYYYVYDIGSGSLKPLTDHSKGKQRLAHFSPDASQVAFVRKNNIYVKDLESGKEKAITEDGKMNRIINGSTDWVYEEEFKLTKGFHWSPDGERIAFLKFDESHVKEWNMKYYGKLYPQKYSFKYPKAGEKNSKVSVHVHDLSEGWTRACEIGDLEYVPRFKWTHKSDKLCIMRMNRHQDSLVFLLTDIGDKEKGAIPTRKLYEESEDTYITIKTTPTFLKEKEGFVWMNETSGYRHIYHYNMQGEKVRQITQGDWVVTELEGVDEKDGKVYFTAAKESSLQRHVYSVGLNGKNEKKLTPRSGTHSADFSKGFEYFIDHHSTANTPETIRLFDAKGKEIKVLESNERLKKTVKSYELPEKEFLKIENREGTKLNAFMIKPPNFDKSKEYPVLMHVYGGPGHNTVKDEWAGRDFLWHQLMAQKGYIVVSVDPRGTGYRGVDFKKCTYKELGRKETKDVIDASKWLAEKPYVDDERIGIWGWSYGGYLTSLCMTKGHEFFSAGVAVAPVTNWRYYDTIYTERFMQTPQENPDGYDENSPINHVGKLEDPYMIVHGSTDDNVHLQNTMMMIQELVRKNKDFEQLIYPNKAHAIAGGSTRWHLFRQITDFLTEEL